MNVDEILAELEAMGSATTKRMLMNNHGVKEPCFGVKIGDLKKIVKRVKKDHQLALDLYASGNYDAMYLAGLIADDERMTKTDLNRWAKAAYGASLPGYTVAGVAAQGRYGWELALKWIESPKANIASAGWSTLSCLVALKADADLKLPHLKKLITRVASSIGTAPDAVRYAMNNYLISVGCYVRSLTDFAVRTAERIGVVTADLGNNQCRVPFAPDYIRKVEQRGAIGRKRRTVKC